MKTSTHVAARGLPWLLGALVGAAALGVGCTAPSQEADAAPDELGTLDERAELAIHHVHALRPLLGLSGLHSFQRKQVFEDALGMTHTRMQQRYRGVRVWGAEVIAHADRRGRMLPPTLAHRAGFDVDVTPSLQPEAVLAQVQPAFALTGSLARQPEVELVVYPEEERLVRPGLQHLDEGQLNATDFLKQVTRFRLAYHVHIEVEQPGDIRHQDMLVDARTGEVLEEWSSLQTAAARGTGNSQHNGVVTLDTNTATGGFELRDSVRPTSGANIVYNLNHGTEGTGSLYFDADNVWGDGTNYKEDPEPTTSANGQTAAVDAAFGIQATWDMYKNVFGRNGIDGRGTPTYARVHFDNGYDNAFFNDRCNCLTFGDGTRRLTYTPLDVVGHEFSHGVTSATAGLIYSKESGGLNESNSDIMGALTEFYTYGAGGQGSVIPDNGGTWTQGEKIVTAEFPNMRHLYKPSKDGKSADAWSPTLSTIDVHYSSGPMNRAFYFLSQGATTTGDTSSTFLPEGMTGIGNQKAGAIWYRALTTYMTPSTDYANARISCIQAARDLFGSGSTEEIAVWSAFTAINVGGRYDGPDAPPTVSVSAGSTSGQVTLNATASDDKGVASVAFSIDGVVVGTATAPPYSVTVDSVLWDDGPHTLTARATDSVGFYTSASTTLTLTNGQLLKNGSFERGYGVGWSNTSGMQVGAILNTPSFDGTKQAKFCGGGGADRIALFQTVTIPASAPSATLSYAVRVETKEATTNVHDTFVVQLKDSAGTVLRSLATYSNLDKAPTHSVASFDISAFRGQTVQLFFQCQEDGSVSTGFLLDRVQLLAAGGGTPDSTPPTVSASASGTSGTIAFSANASDNVAVSKVDFLVDGALVGTDSTSPYSLDFDSRTVANGNHTLTARATDSSGNVGTSTGVSFTVSNAGDTQAPTVSVSESGTTGVITLSATASDNVGVTRVEFLIDGALVGSDTSAPYSVSYDSTALASGTHSLTGRAFDAAGNVGTAAAVSFTLNHTPTNPTFNEVEGNNSTSAANALADSVTKVVGYIGASGDQDFFRITVAAGRTVTVNMTGPDKDYDLYLLSSAGSVLNSSSGAKATEWVKFTNSTAAPATYYIRVIGWAGAFSATVPYNLTLSR